MKKIVGYLPCYSLFFIGNVIFKTNLVTFRWGWRLYHAVMDASICVQDWAGLNKPWEDGEDDKLEIPWY